MSSRTALRLGGDVLLTAFVWLVAVAQWGSRNFAEVGPGPSHTAGTAPDAASFVLVLAATLPVLARRRDPVAVLAITAAASVALAAGGYGGTVHLGPAVALYTIALRSPRAVAPPVIGLAAAALAAIAVFTWVRLDAHGDFGVDLVLWTAAWIAGDRRRLAQRAELDRADRAERERRLTVVEERAHIARELHDSAGHAINTILVQAGAARVHHERDPDRTGAAIRTIEQVARETIDDIDRIVGGLREGGPDTAPLPGVTDIEELARRSGLAVTVAAPGERRRLAPAVDRAAYRIAQEALTNAARHGDGTAAVRVEYGAAALELEVTNPIGHPRPGGGRGLIGMRERAQLLGGTLRAERDGDLFLVLASLPYVR